MDINPLNNSGRAAVNQKADSRGDNTASADNAKPQSGGVSDEVMLTDDAKLLQQLTEQVATTPDVDQGKVEAAKALVEKLTSGEADIDYDGLANSIVDAHSEF